MSIWNTALNILARREHSQSELLTKLQSRFPESLDEIENVLERLQEQGLQSDERYAQMWFNGQIAKYRGPKRIQYESRQKGISSRIEALLSQSEIDWCQLALDAVSRRYSNGASYDDKAKIYRFLSYRGFSGNMIQFAFDELHSQFKEHQDPL
ncbi:regulatory protein RecX [Reinekea marina]|uniref:Regulatory protein RecX n=1 Tax=Reinekea marina TaxID=1310421 RepID=A0ABV7WSI2_9GAMM|nr:regulatory protein RecX [Reinekea marina]MDN3650320.1 regulatory protein RecX [Reinekea marina]